MPRMGLLGGCNSSRKSSAPTFCWRVILLFIILVICRLSDLAVLGVEPVAFSYGVPPYSLIGLKSSERTLQLPAGAPKTTISPLQPAENITCPLKPMLANGTRVTGRCLYNNPVNLIQQCAPSSPSSSIMFTVVRNSWPLQDGDTQALAFIIVHNKSSVQDGQGLPAPSFVVNIEVVQDFSVYPDAVLTFRVGGALYQSSPLSVYTIHATDGFNGFPVWIDYDFTSQKLEIFVGQIEKRPQAPSTFTYINLADTLQTGSTYAGFEGLISDMASSSDSDAMSDHFLISDWTFNSNGPAPDVLRNPDGTPQDPAAEAMKRRRGRITRTLLITIPCVLVFLILVFIIYKLKMKNDELIKFAKVHHIDPTTLAQGPRNFKHKELSTATKGFSQLLGRGGFGCVFMGKLVLKTGAEPTEIAVKQISATSEQGASEFLAEVKIIGQAQHRNLVRLLGWCHDKGELLLVYEYMPNGSVDRHLYQATRGETVLTWSRRLKIASGVATALVFLHDDWEQRVIHRDVKSSNVMLDRDFNARLGDFGLARTSKHGELPLYTAVAGTRGYLAPELGMTFQPTEKTDVYSFGALVLELATGKKPMLSREDQHSLKEILLVAWVWGLYEDTSLLDAADCTLQNAYDQGEMIMFLKIGLLCCHPNPDERPTMRDVINIWKGLSPFPPIPRSRPVSFLALNPSGLALDCNWDDTAVVAIDGTQEIESGTETFAVASDGDVALAILSQDDTNSDPSHKTEGGKGTRNTKSLPF